MNTNPRYTFISKILAMVPGPQRAAVLVVAILAALGYFAMTGCANLAAPETAEQRLAYVDSQFTGLVHAAADLRETGALDPETVAELDPLITRGDELLDVAWSALEVGNPDTALEAVNTLQQLLPQIRQHLETQTDEQHDSGAQGPGDADDDRHAGPAERERSLAADPGRAGRGAGSDRRRARADPRAAPGGRGTLAGRLIAA